MVEMVDSWPPCRNPGWRQGTGIMLFKLALIVIAFSQCLVPLHGQSFRFFNDFPRSSRVPFPLPMAHGGAMYWQWGKDADEGDILEIYPVCADNWLNARISRNRELDRFCVRDAAQSIASDALEHVFAELELYLVRIHGE
jgi:hypothetical protein